MPTKYPLLVNTFQNPDGSPVANGYIKIRLNVDGSINDGQLQSNYVNLPLDSSGVISGSPTFWPNSEISPSGTYYVENVYKANGQLVAGPSIAGIAPPWSYVRTASASQAASPSNATGQFTSNNAGHTLVLGFISYGGVTPINYPDTTTDTAGNTYNLIAQGGCITNNEQTQYAVYLCKSCVSSGANNFTCPVAANTINIAVGVEYTAFTTGTLDTYAGPLANEPNAFPNTLFIDLATQGDLAVGLSFCVSGVCDVDTSATPRYSSTDYMFQDAPVPSSTNYIQSFTFTGGSGQSFFLVLIKD